MLLLFTLCAGFNLMAQKTYVPDGTIEAAVRDLGLDDVMDDSILTANLFWVTELYTPGCIHDLTGLEDFVALRKLEACFSTPEILDFSLVPSLLELSLESSTNIGGLDLSSNINLEELRMNGLMSTDLETIDLSNNANLRILDLSYNDLEELDVTNNVLLEYLYCGDNNLTELDVSNCLDLKKLVIFSNLITEIDLTENIALIDLECFENLLTELNLMENNTLELIHCEGNFISELDLSGNPNLERVWLKNMPTLTKLNMKSGNNPAIEDFECSSNINLDCIEVDNAEYSTDYWWEVDDYMFFSEDCESLALDNLELNENSIYPNPSSDKFFIASSNSKYYSIYNLQGQLMQNGSLNFGVNEINTSNLHAGIYIVEIDFENSQKQYQQKVTIIN